MESQATPLKTDELEYVGFWARAGAEIIDLLLLSAITLPLLTFYYGDSYWSGEEFIKGPLDFLLSYFLPAVITVVFWVLKQATPGKMAVSAKILDARTGSAPSTGQCIGRYLAYVLSSLPLGLGFIWIAFDSRKQGWHDKLAGTVVIRPKNRQRSVSFES